MEQTSIVGQLLQQNHERDAALLCERACPNTGAERLDPARERVPDWENIRSPFSRDADRILHSMAFTRYIDKTQVFYLFDNDFITHRVLHVQFVSKIARTIARALRLNEDLAEAIALGHDIGHAPFGHDGEELLNDICKETGIGAFCHNAQGVRWVLELENKGRGWNLCVQTLDGMLTHNGESWNRELAPRRDKTADDVRAEYDECLRGSEYARLLTPMTLEGCVTRFADVIAYVGRDIEDAIKLSLVERTDLPVEAVRVLGDNNSSIINTLVMDLLENSAGRDCVCYSEPVFEALQALLKFNYERIYLNPRAHEQKSKLRGLFEVIFKSSLDDLQNERPDSNIMEFYARRADASHIRNTPPARLVVDYISGMTDDFFIAEARRLLLPVGFGRHAR